MFIIRNLTLINNTDNDNLPFIPNLYSPLGNKIGNFHDTDTELWESRPREIVSTGESILFLGCDAENIFSTIRNSQWK